MKIYIVGIGMDGSETLTAQAGKIIQKSDVIIGAKRVTEPFRSLGKDVFVSWKTDEITAFLNVCGCETAAVLMSGDCGFYSGAADLKKALAGYDTEIISGISTPVYLCAKLGLAWQDMGFVSLHGTDGNIVRNVRRTRRCFFLLGGSVTPSDICTRLCEYDMGTITVHIGACLAYPDERVISGTAGELRGIECAGLCAVITENPSPENRIRSGIPDGEFIRDDVPMTKSEVRASVASKLEVGCNDTVWDIGCGTGSVSVEAALAAYSGTVFAADKNGDAISLTIRNARKFGCDNIRTVHGSVPDILSELPPPDRVFIGGAGGNISAVTEAALKGGKCRKTVMTAVTLETLNEAVEALRSHGMTTDVTQIAVTRTRTVGTHTMFAAQNPVFVIEGTTL